MGEKTAATRERILNAALSLFNESGTATVSTNHIAVASRLSVGNLYYHFKNKDEIIRALYERIAREVILQDLYREVAAEMEVPVPDDDMKPFLVDVDGGEFDPANPAAMLAGYETGATARGATS